jgi:hypothetical protein
VAIRWAANSLIEARSVVMPSIMRERGVTVRAASQGPGKAGWAVMLL